MSILFTNGQDVATPGYFRIGSVALQIPPEDLNLHRVTAKDEVMPLRSKYALQVKTGHARWDLSIRWKALITSSNGNQDLSQWEDVRRILAMLKSAPFVEVENADVRAQLAAKDPQANSIRLGFALDQLMIQSSSDIPDCLDCSLKMALFNYQPYSKDFAYLGASGGGDASASPAFKEYLRLWMQENLSGPFNSGADDEDAPPVWTAQDPKAFQLGWRQYYAQNGAPGSAAAAPVMAIEHSPAFSGQLVSAHTQSTFTSQGARADAFLQSLQTNSLPVSGPTNPRTTVQATPTAPIDPLSFLPIDHFTSQGDNDGVTFRYEKRTIDLSEGDATDCYVQQIAMMFSNNLATIPLAGFQYPTMQHLGAATTMVSVSLMQKGYAENGKPNGLAKISNMLDTLEDQYISMRTQWRSTTTAYRLQSVTVENQILNMFGIFGLMPTEMNIQPVNEAADMIQAQLVATQYENLVENLEGYQVKGPLYQYSQALSTVFSNAKVMAALSDPKQAASVTLLAQFIKAQTAGDQGWLINYLNNNLGILPKITGQVALPAPLSQAGLDLFSNVVPYYTAEAPYLSNIQAAHSYSYVEFFFLTRQVAGSGDNPAVVAVAPPSVTFESLGVQHGQLAYQGAPMAPTAFASTLSLAFVTQLAALKASVESDPTATAALIQKLYAAIFTQRLTDDPAFLANVNTAKANPVIAAALSSFATLPGADPINKGHGAYFDLGLRGSATTFSPASYFSDPSLELQAETTKKVTALLPSMFSAQQAFNAGTTGSSTSTSELGSTASDALGILLRAVLPNFSMRAAFPTYKLFLIEEDNLHLFSMYDNFYSYASVIEIETENHRERGQTAHITLTNLAGIFSHKLFDNTTLGKMEQTFYKWLPKQPNGATAMAGMQSAVVTHKTLDGQNLQEGKDNGTGRPNFVPLKYFALQPGSKIQIRMGYDDNPDNLIPVFQGQITEIQGDEILEITAQGFQQELATASPDTLATDGYSPVGIVGQIFQNATNLAGSVMSMNPGDAWLAAKNLITLQKGPAFGGARLWGDGGGAGSVIGSLVKASNAKHFGHWQINQNPDEYLKGFTWAPTIGSWIQGVNATVGAALMSAYDRSDENILINHFVGGNSTFSKSSTNRPVNFEDTSVLTPASYHVPDSTELTPWTLIKDVSRRYPEYLLAVKNYGFPFMSDATLVFGHPLDWYYARMPYFGEAQAQPLTRDDQANFQTWWMNGKRSAFIAAYNQYSQSNRLVTEAPQQQGNMPPGIGILGSNFPNGPVSSTSLDSGRQGTHANLGEQVAASMDNNPVMAEQVLASQIEQTNASLAAKIAATTGHFQSDVKGAQTTFLYLQRDMRQMVALMRNTDGALTINASDRVKPIRRYHFIDHLNIIHNGIELNEKINNAVSLRGNIIKANAMIPSQYTRILDVNAQVIAPEQNIPTTTDGLLMCVAQSFLKEEVGKMYRGELMIRLDPEIEPQDIVMITDPSTGIVGPVDVESVMHIFNQEMGAITIIRPRAWVMINESAEANILCAIWQSLSAAYNSGADASAEFEAMSPATKNTAAVAAVGATVATGATLLFAESAGLFGGPAVWVVAGLVALGMRYIAQLQTWLCPSLVAPLSRYGRPWIGGLEGYRVCDLATFAVNKFDQIVTDEIAPTIEGWRLAQSGINPYGDSSTAVTNNWRFVPLTPEVKDTVQTLIRSAAKKYGVPEDMAMALAKQESGFNPTLVSSAGAIGVMQLMPGTARQMGVTSPFDPAQNVDGGMKYLKSLYVDPTLGNSQSWPIAFAAYNAGPWAEQQILAGKRAMPKETRNYVATLNAAVKP